MTRAFQPDVLQCCLAFNGEAVLLKHNLYQRLAEYDDWQKFTLQYLDANNNIVNTQVAVPSESDLALHAVRAANVKTLWDCFWCLQAHTC